MDFILYVYRIWFLKVEISISCSLQAYLRFIGIHEWLNKETELRNWSPGIMEQDLLTHQKEIVYYVDLSAT